MLGIVPAFIVRLALSALSPRALTALTVAVYDYPAIRPVKVALVVKAQ